MARARRGRGEGGVSRRKDGLWVGRVSLGYDAAGKHRRKAVYGKTKGEALERLAALKAAGPNAAEATAGTLTVGQHLTRWLHGAAKAKLRPKTWERYQQLVDLHLVPSLGGVKLAKLSPLHVEQCYAALVRPEAGSAWTAKTAGVVLGVALKHAVKLGLIPANPAADVAKPRPADKEMLFLTPAQAKLFVKAAASHRLGSLIAVAVGTGLRQGELFALRWGDVDLAAGAVHVRRSLSWVKGKPLFKEPKSKAGRRTVTLPAPATAALAEHRAACGKPAASSLVWPTATGGPQNRQNFVPRVFKPAAARAAVLCEGAGVDAPPAGLRFHDLRHTHASALVASGQSLKAIARRLGHASVEITLRVYAHLMPADDAKLADAAAGLFW